MGSAVARYRAFCQNITNSRLFARKSHPANDRAMRARRERRELGHPGLAMRLALFRFEENEPARSGEPRREREKWHHHLWRSWRRPRPKRRGSVVDRRSGRVARPVAAHAEPAGRPACTARGRTLRTHASTSPVRTAAATICCGAPAVISSSSNTFAAQPKSPLRYATAGRRPTCGAVNSGAAAETVRPTA